MTCFHCRKPGHFKKDFTKYHAWREKKGNFITLICAEVNIASIPTNTWWLDSGATIHVSVSMQGCLHYRKPRSEEKDVFTGNDTSARVEAIRTFRLLLNIGHFVDLVDTFLYLILDAIWCLYLLWKISTILVLLEIEKLL